MTNHTHQGTNQLGAIPRRAEYVHPAKLHYSIDTVAACNFGEDLFPVGIGNGQSKRLQSSIKFRNCLDKIVDHEDG